MPVYYNEPLAFKRGFAMISSILFIISFCLHCLYICIVTVFFVNYVGHVICRFLSILVEKLCIPLFISIIMSNLYSNYVSSKVKEKLLRKYEISFIYIATLLTYICT